MKEIVLAGVFALVSTVAILAAPASAFAATFDDQVALCAAAADSQGVASAADYRPRFVKSKGAAVKKVTIKLIPAAEGESLTAECEIKRGEVVNVSIVA